ncbi:MAG: hypothetical protein FWH19_00970 [Treponema sp.]|nr:hypothetical protein [Treponema sp.]
MAETSTAPTAGASESDYPRGLTFEQVWASIQETDKQIKEMSRKLGDLGNRFGELAEHLVGPSIMEKFNEQGFDFTRRSRDVEIKISDNPKSWAEVDIILENGDFVIAVEVKSKPKEVDVEKHIKRMEVLRQTADLRGDRRKYRGAVAGAIMNQGICDYILQNGFYLIEQTGDTVKLTIPEGFVPRDW